MNQIIHTNGDNFYVFNGIAYDNHFPLEWAINPKKMDQDFTCDPSDCKNCLNYGSYNGVFIGYCANCAAEYNYQRGNGFIDYVEEFKHEGFYDENSVWQTYLKYVNLDEIGILPKDTLPKDTLSSISVLSEEDECFQTNVEEQDDEIRWMNCEIDYLEEEEEPLYHYDEDYFEEGPPPLTIEDLTLEEEKKEKQNDCLLN